LIPTPRKKSARTVTRRSGPRNGPAPATFNGCELKAVDSIATLAADTTGALALINGLVPGTGFSQRVGRRVHLTHVELHFKSQVTPATGVDQYHRVMVVRDKQANAAAPAIADILTSVSTNHFPNLINQERFKILYDKRFYLNATAEPASGKAWDLLLPLGVEVQYNDGVAGTVADIATNSLYVVSIGSEVAGVTAGTEFFVSRVHFTDN